MNREKKHLIYPHFSSFLKKHVLAWWLLFFPGACIGCGVMNAGVCNKCLSQGRRAFENKNITAVFDYKNNAVRRSLRRFKYRRTKSIAHSVAPFLYDAILDIFSDEIHYSSEFRNNSILLIPIPLTKKRKRSRGYNQAEELAKSIADIGHDNFLSLRNNVLEKIRETKPQTKTLNRKERLTNLRGCFAVSNREAIHGKTVILIDDITTTGATFLEAEKVVMQAGAKRVLCLAAAH